MNALTGHYRLHPGSAQPIKGTRPVLGADRLSQLLRGQPQAGALQRLGHVFSLCSHAHQHAGRLAWAADAGRRGGGRRYFFRARPLAGPDKRMGPQTGATTRVRTGR